MSVRLIVRLLDAEIRLLGWCEVYAHMPGDGTLRASGSTPLQIEQGGLPAWTSVHWADANVEVRTPLPRSDVVKAGATINLRWDQPIIVFGTPPTDLPCVTVGRSVVIAPPSGTFGVPPARLDVTARAG